MPPYAYDPRLVKVEDTYYIIWCQDFYGASIGLARTKDFKTFVRVENPFLPFNRNAVLFPRKLHGNFMMLSRPSDSGHTPFGDIFLSESPDLVYWGKHRHVMGKGEEWWQVLKIGGGAAPGGAGRRRNLPRRRRYRMLPARWILSRRSTRCWQTCGLRVFFFSKQMMKQPQEQSRKNLQTVRRAFQDSSVVP